MRGLGVLVIVAILAGASCQENAAGLDQPMTTPIEMQNIIGGIPLPSEGLPTETPAVDTEVPEDGFLTVFLSDAEAEIIAANQTIDYVANMVARIAGGHPATENEYPYAASIAIYGTHACGGTLIAPRVVLTAAHCVYDKESNDFYSLSDMTLRIGNVDRSKGESRWPKGLIIPNTFQPSQGFYGDVALILLDSPVSGRTSKLVTKPKQAEMYKALGWGKTEAGFISYTLNQVELRGVAENVCKGLLEKYKMGGLPKDHFCAGLNSSGADTCEGDSGGPLVSGAYQAGITSYGPPESECGKGVNFGVYTSVAYWNTWIQDSMSVYNLRGKKKPWKFNKPQFNVCYEGGTYKSSTAETMDQSGKNIRAAGGVSASASALPAKKTQADIRNFFSKRQTAPAHADRTDTPVEDTMPASNSAGGSRSRELGDENTMATAAGTDATPATGTELNRKATPPSPAKKGMAKGHDTAVLQQSQPPPPATTTTVVTTQACDGSGSRGVDVTTVVVVAGGGGWLC